MKDACGANNIDATPVMRHWGEEAIDTSSKSLPRLKFEWFCDFLGEGKGRLLEIGCNGGRFLKTLSLRYPGLELFGCDIDAQAVKRAGNFPELSVCAADGNNLPFAAGSFDYVLIVDYLEHVPDFRVALAEAFRVLKPGGKLAAFIPCEGQTFSPYEFHRRLFGWDVKKETCGHYPIKKRELLGWLQGAGFPVLKRRHSYHWIGQVMDFSFFWLVAKSKSLSEWWWNRNPYYHPAGADRPRPLTRVAHSAIAMANFLAFSESKVLQKVGWGASGLHLLVQKPAQVSLPKASYGAHGETLLDKGIRRWRFGKVLRQLREEQTVLDVGCGFWGHFLRTASGRIGKGIGIDRMVAEACGDSDKVSLQAGDIEGRLEVPDASVDVVTSLAVLEHVKDPEFALSEMYRVLKPGGKLILTTPSKRAKPLLEFLAFRMKWINSEEIADHKRYYDGPMLRSALVGRGFSPEGVEIRTFQAGFNLMAVARK